MATKRAPRARIRVSTPRLVMIFRGESVSGHPGTRNAPNKIQKFPSFPKFPSWSQPVWKLLLYLFLRIAVLFFVRKLPRGGFEFLHAGQFSHKGSLWIMRHGFRFEMAMSSIEIFRRPRSRPPSNGFGREFRYPQLVFREDSESRSRGRFRKSKQRK